jgi:hypothetical protein
MPEIFLFARSWRLSMTLICRVRVLSLPHVAGDGVAAPKPEHDPAEEVNFGAKLSVTMFEQ